jgi:carbamoyl-phosphate synthase large subunit
MSGQKLKEFDLPPDLTVDRILREVAGVSLREVPGVDPVLGPEMHSTGEVMGIGETFGEGLRQSNDRGRIASATWNSIHQR